MALTKVTGELVDIGDLDISNVGSIQLDSIAGDADSNTSITFSGSDVITVATGGSTAATFNADQTTTFSGAISGTSATLTTADNTAQLTLISTDTDANQGPILNLNRNPNEAGADNDYLGQIYWSGHNDAGTPEEIIYSKLTSQILDASDGTEDANMVAYVMKGGTRADMFRLGPTEAVFNESSNDIDFRVESNGIADMFFVDAGNDRVGIGTGSPQALLTITDNDDGTMNEMIRLVNDPGSSTSTGTGVQITFANHHSGTEVASLRSIAETTGAGTGLQFYTHSGSSLTEKVRINKDGNVGIGTSAPEEPLHVSEGDSGVTPKSGTLAFFENDGAAKISIGSANDNDGQILFGDDGDNDIGAITYSHGGDRMEFKVNGSERLRIDSSGKIGIGTTSPSHKTEVSDGAVASKYDADHHVAIRALSGGQYIQYDSANPLEFVSVDTYPNSGATSRARLTTNGHWLVGTTSSTINSSNFGGVIFADGRPKFSKNVDGSSHVMNVYGNAGEMRVFGDGDVINTNNSYGQISDVSLKENIVDASSKLADINKVKVRNFNFKGNDLKQIGVVAQELETVFPALVTTDEEDDIKTVKYSVFVPILIKALQEADDKIDALEARIATLESS